MRIYVGNLSFQTSQEGLRDLFSQHGTVEEAAIITDRETGRSRGFAFVTMPNDSEGQEAINALNGHELDGRPLNINEARPKTQRTGGGGGRRDW